MKKFLGILSILLVIGLLSTFAFAESSTPKTQPAGVNIEEKEAWFKERMESKKEHIDESVKEGLITKEESKRWNDHFAYMEKFHKENGFMPGCHGVGNGNHHGRHGGRMMRGNRNWK